MEFTNKEKEYLIPNINSLFMDEILKKHKLSLKFIIEYILNEKYYSTSEEYNIDFFTILKYQSHIDKSNLIFEICNYY